ncbi:PREDICTED: uncharacterized protein LOC106146439 [Chinchilla lanigera]|uniref:uncharacterized protein LOC106146439 n=1 Tax=Chinchilla lanigera TaxID=34839 RepID=UPI00069762DB|nr:PREDICTED: uncharacterized protein LOC106146439 [Chinchilla lanigera]
MEGQEKLECPPKPQSRKSSASSVCFTQTANLTWSSHSPSAPWPWAVTVIPLPCAKDPCISEEKNPNSLQGMSMWLTGMELAAALAPAESLKRQDNSKWFRGRLKPPQKPPALPAGRSRAAPTSPSWRRPGGEAEPCVACVPPPSPPPPRRRQRRQRSPLPLVAGGCEEPARSQSPRRRPTVDRGTPEYGALPTFLQVVRRRPGRQFEEEEEGAKSFCTQK